MKSNFRLQTFSLVVLMTVSGCSTTPVYDWRNSKTAGRPHESVTMETAIAYLDKAKDGYNEAVRIQMQDEASVSKALIVGTGALLAATGLKAHTDALLVGGTLTGMTYSLGGVQLPRARVLAYLAGIDALNCAEAGVAPIRVSDYKGLQLTLTNLETNKDDLESAIQKLQVEYDKSPVQQDDAKKLLKSAQKTLAASSSIIRNTNSFMEKTVVAAAILLNQVDKIDKAVTQAIVTGTPDLSQVKLLSSSMGGDINAIINRAVTNSNASKAALLGTTAPQGTNNDSALKQAMDTVSAAQAAVIRTIKDLKSRLPKDFDSAAVDAVKACNLPVVPAPLVADQTHLQFFAGESETLNVVFSGGTKEYVAEDKTLPPGFSVKQPGPNGTKLVVEMDGTKVTAAAEFELRVHDQTAGADGILIEISVSPAKEPAATPPVVPNPTPGKAEAQSKKPLPGPGSIEAEATLVKKLINVTVGTKTYRILASTAIPADKSILVNVCGAPDDQARTEIEKAIVEKTKVKTKLNVQKAMGC